ncbi:GDYXXLXY domain-containing protein [Flavobacterium sp. H122]|uniref:GDYXXLXY domain-containing protein n=1 Tax=Flavobacterium sp. H122 TaxID=2529860 RepID=UPI0010AB47ED|nr:GDYXXLXY domain-containing protein [Flavobacterium sp. H122]
MIKNKKLLYAAFGILILVQLAIPFQMIRSNNDILENGKTFKFKCIPFDPYDAFRGKYIDLSFDINTAYSDKKIDVSKDVYAVLENDKDGFVKVKRITTSIPPEPNSYLKVKASSQYEYNGKTQVSIELPFNRFYMNEYKAPIAEKVYNAISRDQTKNIYAEIAIKDGQGVIKDVIIDSIPIKDYIKKSSLKF